PNHITSKAPMNFRYFSRMLLLLSASAAAQPVEDDGLHVEKSPPLSEKIFEFNYQNKLFRAPRNYICWIPHWEGGSQTRAVFMAIFPGARPITDEYSRYLTGCTILGSLPLSGRWETETESFISFTIAQGFTTNDEAFERFKDMFAGPPETG